MPTARKIEDVEKITDLLSRSSVVIAANYRGLSVAEATEMRRQLKQAGVDVRVVKNSLFLRAAQSLSRPELSELAEGPTALIFGYDDPLASVKTVVEYERSARNSFSARRAYLDGQIVAGGLLSELASLPPREVMIGQIAGALQSPVANLASLLQAAVQEFSGLLDARTAQMDPA